jgi:hypothetical protein
MPEPEKNEREPPRSLEELGADNQRLRRENAKLIPTDNVFAAGGYDKAASALATAEYCPKPCAMACEGYA